MPNIKKYTIREWNNNEAVFVVDHDKATDKLFHEVNNFFCDAKSRLDDEDGNVTVAVLKMIAKYCFTEQVSNPLNNYGIMSHFGTDERPEKYVEGFPRLDGSFGILLLRVDVPEIEIDDEYDVVNLDEMPEAPTPSF